MKIVGTQNNPVPLKETCKQLKALGAVQDSLLYWHTSHEEAFAQTYPFMKCSMEECEIFSAPTVTELMAGMPQDISSQNNEGEPLYRLCLLRVNEKDWMATYHNNQGYPAINLFKGARWPLWTIHENPAEALAQLKLTLLSQGIHP